jgi:enamine deaminase RidA (YjgF/YER057c/UK114 family)
VGNIIAVTGLAPIAEDGSICGQGNVYEQARRCLAIIKDALERVGGSLGDIIRARIFLKNMEARPGGTKAYGEVFLNIRSALCLCKSVLVY